MSSLWTPGGEVPVDRNRPNEPTPSAEPSPATGAGEPPDEVQLREQMARMQQLLLERPAGEVVAQHAMGLAELAVLHLGQHEPRLQEARLAIDAVAALVEGLEGRLGDAEAALRQTLPQLRMYFVEASDRARSGSERTGGPNGPDPDEQ